MKINVTYIISNIDKALAFEWIAEELNKEKFNLSFILLNSGESALETYLIQHQIPVHRITYLGKKNIPNAILQCLKIFKKEQTQVIHCHLFDANVVGLVAGKLAGIRKRIFTRHHSTFHHQYFPRAVFYDKILNRLATDIIAISQTVKEVLMDKEKVNPKKIHLIHHGFRLGNFENVSQNRIEALQEKYKIKGHYPVIGVIARQTQWKGIQYIIPAFQKIIKNYPDAYLILANAKGDYKAEITKLLNDLPEENYLEVAFEKDLEAFYQVFDMHIHTPIDALSEAFGQTYIEALAAGIPSIFTLSGVANELIVNEQNALIVPFQDSIAIEKSILKLLIDNELKENLVSQGKKDIQRFALKNMIEALEKLYLSKT